MASRKLPTAKGVARIDEPGGHGVGWYARVTFRGKTFSKYFADGAHGGTRKAFDLALAWRDAMEKRLGKPRTDRLLPGTSSRSRTGVPGVYKSRESYVVAWNPEPGQLRREFISVSKYGEEEAFRRAVELRRKREREMYGRSVSSRGQGRPVSAARRQRTAGKQQAAKRAKKTR